MSPAGDPLSRLAALLIKAVEKGMKQALQDGLKASQRALSGGGGPRSKTGRLARSLYTKVEVRGDSVIGELGSNSFIAGVHENGATIQAKKGKYLKFKIQNHWVQVRRVVIPARPFLKPGREEVEKVLEQRIFEALKEELS